MMQLSAQNDREILVVRSFGAPRRMVYDALTKPELIQRWLLGPQGWTMPVCNVDLRVGGAYRFEWLNTQCDQRMAISGQYLELVPGEKIVHSERFDEAWYPGNATVTTLLSEQNGVTTMRVVIAYDTREARDGVLKSGMEQGMAASYDRLAGIIEG